MQFQVPQFETENKLIGPFTIAQFAYIGAAGIISFLLFSVLTTWFWLIISTVLVGGSFAMALGKVNGRAMPVFMSAMFSYLWEPKTLTIKPGLDEPRVGPSIAPSGLAMPPQSFARPVESVIAPAYSPVSAPKSKIENVMAPMGAPIKAGPFIVSGDEDLKTSPAPVVEKATGITAKINASYSSSSETEAVPSAESRVLSGGVEKRRSRLQSLFNKITTSSSPIPFREESLKEVSSKGYTFIQKSSGETIAARRVDYR